MTKKNKQQSLSRRQFIQTGGAAAAGLLLAACGSTASESTTAPAEETQAENAAETINQEEAQNEVVAQTGEETAVLEPTPQCDDDDDETPAQTAGPFYTPNTPERINIREEVTVGTPLIVTGRVLSTNCEPLANAIIDFWHADDAGDYDNDGFRLRGHQFTDANGTYRLETIVPGLYPGRTRHIHVKVQGEGTGLLTTQVYWPNEPDNGRDGIFDPALVMDVEETAEGQTATFDFVLA